MAELAEHPDVRAAAADPAWLARTRQISLDLEEFWDVMGWLDRTCPNECGHCQVCGAAWAYSWVQRFMSDGGLLVAARIKRAERDRAEGAT